ncbi:inosamine-phosphate amidinotransferase 1 [Mastigocladus laminosus UU774]|nr:inosamine-phosphate amidinotransferase 1 [Westiellopsis prolifica IICB1]TFI51866.1 inosamine-phosphate amidinotransferase 1 [Mastigocladus laminosus UU774]
MSKVRVDNEWDTLEEVIVGRAANARIACPDRGLFAVEYRDYGSIENIPSGQYSDRIIEETEEDLDKLVSTLQSLGIVVQRPDVVDHAIKFRTPDWESDGQYNYCPRDLFIAVGTWIIEAPMTLRARLFETISFKPILMDYLQSGARWISAPKPRLADEIYNIHDSSISAINNYEPLFDAANILRLGKDIFYLISDTGNRCGAFWLQTILGEEYRVHTYDNIYSGSHLDTTIALIRPGLVVVNAERVGEQNLPDLFKGWDVIYLTEVVDIGYTATSYASKWIGINLLMVNPNLAIVDKSQTPLIKQLEKHGVDVVQLQLRHARTLGGGFHCVTLDVRRKGSLESYCTA